MIFGLIFLLGLNFNSDYSNSNLINKYLNDSEDIVLDSKLNARRYRNEIKGDFLVLRTLDSKYSTRFIAKSLKKREKTLINSKEKINLYPGQIIRIEGKIRLPDRNRNPKTFNYRDYLKSDYIYTEIDLNKFQIVGKDMSRLIYYQMKFKDIIDKSFDRIEDKKNSNLMKSAFTGDKSFIEEKDREKINDLGLGHLIAISGFHIGLIYIFIYKLLSKTILNKRSSEIIALLIIFIYILLIDMPISSIRAFLLLLGIVSGKLLERRVDSLNIVSAIGYILLIFRPLWFLSLSFQLSFLGVISIYIILPRLKNIYDFKTSVGIFLSILLGTYPISIYYFNNLSISHFFSNIFGIFPFTLAFYFSIFGLFISRISNRIAIILFKLANRSLNIMNLILDFFHIDSFKLKSPNFSEFLIIYFIIFIIIGLIDYKTFPEKLNRIVFNLIIISIIISFSFSILDQNIYIKFIDIGQGDASLIEYRNTKYLIDTGERNIVDYLIKNDIRNIDGLIISHFDSDHMGDAKAIIKDIGVDKIYIGHSPKMEKKNIELFNEARTKDIDIVLLKDIKELKLGKNRLLLIPPDQRLKSLESENEKSLLALLYGNKRKVFFTGDIEIEGEKRLIDMKLPKVDILKSPHHGSNTSSSKELLQKIEPEIIVIQSGVENRYSHPSEEVLTRYEDIRARVLRNDLLGNISIEIDRDGNMRTKSYLKYGFKDRIEEYGYIVLINTLSFIFIIYELKKIYRNYDIILSDKSIWRDEYEL